MSRPWPCLSTASVVVPRSTPTPSLPLPGGGKGWGSRACLVVTLLAFGLLQAGCAPEPRHSIRFGLATAPINLDPRYATDAVSDRIARLLFARLVDFDPHFQPIPSLASWRALTPSRYRFVLGHRWRSFHDGHRLTAKDVQATYASVLQGQVASPHRGALSIIQRIEVLDEDTVEFYLQRSDPLFPGRLGIGILPAHLIAKNHPFNTRPVGSGPLKLLAWSTPGRLVLERPADGQRIEFLTAQDPTVRVLKLLKGEIDLFQGDIPYELEAWLAERKEVSLSRVSGTTMNYLGFNLRDPAVAEPLVRQAIAHAIDRDAIIRYVLKGAARKAASVLPPEHWAGYRGAGSPAYDPERALSLLQQAGYSDARPLRIIYTTSNNSFRVRLATIIQYQLARVGIQTEIRSYDWGTLYADIKAGRFQMYSLSWVGLKIPDIFRYAFHSSALPPVGANRGRFSSRLADRLIEAAEQSEDPAEQARLYLRLQSHLLEQLPYVPLWYEDVTLVARRGLTPYPLAADGNYDGLIAIRWGKNGARIAAN